LTCDFASWRWVHGDQYRSSPFQPDDKKKKSCSLLIKHAILRYIHHVDPRTSPKVYAPRRSTDTLGIEQQTVPIRKVIHCSITGMEQA
jgi:hypothetical protein